MRERGRPDTCVHERTTSAADFEEQFALGRVRRFALLAREAAAGGAYEGGEVRDVLVVHLFERSERAPQRQARAEEHLIRALQRGARLWMEAAAPEADGVEAAHARGVAVGREEGQNVLHDLRLAADHRVAAEAHELVRPDVRREEGVILYDDVARDGDAVREDVVVAHLAVVRDVRVDHQEVATAYARRLPFTARAVQSRVL